MMVSQKKRFLIRTSPPPAHMQGLTLCLYVLSPEEGEEGEDEEPQEGSSSEEDEPAAAGGQDGESQLTRAERRELKKKQAGKKEREPGGQGQEDDEADADLVNPNHTRQKLSISDLAAPRVLSRRERHEAIF